LSAENLKKYGQICAEDAEVRKKAKEIGLQDIEGQIAYAKTLGLEFSKEDFKVLAKEAGLEEKKELSEEDLKKVAGGIVSTTALMVAGAGVGLAGGLAAGSKTGW
jgi:predicted ribosomally synthesized peptide with nif11-like leader